MNWRGLADKTGSMSMVSRSNEPLFPKRLSIVAFVFTVMLAVGVASLVGYMKQSLREVDQEQVPILEMASINVRLMSLVNLRLEHLATRRMKPTDSELSDVSADVESLEYNFKQFRESLAQSKRFKKYQNTLVSDSILRRTRTVIELLSRGQSEEASDLLGSPEYRRSNDDFSHSLSDITEALAKQRDESTANQLHWMRALIAIFMVLVVTLAFVYAKIYRAYRFNLQMRIEAERHRQQLIHVLCHDLGNPVAAINGFVPYATRSNESIKQKALEMIGKSAFQAQSIIDLIRQMQALESGKLSLEVENHPLVELVSAAIDQFAEKVREKEIELVVSIEPDLSVRVEKTSFINSVASNLLSNAIKFSKRGSRIEIGAHRASRAGWIEFSVRDHGIGMSRTLTESLFDETLSTSRPGTSGELGTGFGMPLARKFVLAYGGEITVTSSEEPQNHGTEIRLKLRNAA